MSLRKQLIAASAVSLMFAKTSWAKCREFEKEQPAVCATISRFGSSIEKKRNGDCCLDVSAKDLETTFPSYGEYPLTRKLIKEKASLYVKSNSLSCRKLEQGESVRGVLVRHCNDNRSVWEPKSSYPEYTFGESVELNIGNHKGSTVACARIKTDAK